MNWRSECCDKKKVDIGSSGLEGYPPMLRLRRRRRRGDGVGGRRRCGWGDGERLRSDELD